MTTPTPPGDPDKDAFDSLAAELATVSLENAPPFQLDAMYASDTVRYMMPRLAPFRPSIVALAGFAPLHFDGIETKARALRYVHAELARRAQAVRNVPVLAAEGWKLRGILMSSAETLAFRGIVDPQVLVKLREGSGYRDLVDDLVVLVRMFRAIGESQPDEVNVKPAERDRAEALANELGVIVGRAADIDATQAQLVEQRWKVAILLLRSHDELRRAMTYLRWHEGDATSLVPSLYPAGKRSAPGRDSTTAEKTERSGPLADLHQELHTLTGTPHLPAEDNPFTDDSEDEEK
jgi:hypothetical protein